MPDIEIKAKLNLDTSDSKEAGKEMSSGFIDGVRKSLESTASRFAPSGEKKGGTVFSAMAVGVAVGSAVGGVISSALGTVSDALSEFPVIVAIMKVLKYILTLLFIPLIPILLPTLKLLAAMASALAPVMTSLADALTKLFAGDLSGFMEGVGDAAVAAAKALWSILSKPENWVGIATTVGLFFAAKAIWNMIAGAIAVAIGGHATAAGAVAAVAGAGISWGAIGTFLLTAIVGAIAGAIPAAVIGGIVYTGFRGMINTMNDLQNKIVSDVNKSMEGAKAALAAVKAGTSTYGVSGPSTTVSTIGTTKVGNVTTVKLSNGKSYQTYDDMIWRPGQNPVGISPEDTLIATKGGLGGGSNITININKPNVRGDDDIKELVRQISRELQIGTKRYASYV